MAIIQHGLKSTNYVMGKSFKEQNWPIIIQCNFSNKNVFKLNFSTKYHGRHFVHQIKISSCVLEDSSKTL